MKICKAKVRCYECKKQVEIGYEIVLNRLFLKRICLCETCCKTLYNNLSKQFVPKSPKNVVTRKRNKNVT